MIPCQCCLQIFSYVQKAKRLAILKLIDRLRATRWTPPDYWQTDNSNGLVMVIRNYHWLNSASRVIISTCPHQWFKQESVNKHTLFDLDLWLTTLTYNPRLAKVKVDHHAKNQGQRSNGLNRRAPTDKWMDTHTCTHTHGCYQTYYLPCYAVDKNTPPDNRQYLRYTMYSLHLSYTTTLPCKTITIKSSLFTGEFCGNTQIIMTSFTSISIQALWWKW